MERLTILLLEDEPVILMDLELAASDRGYEVLSSSTCEDAIALLRSDRYCVDVAILDVSLGHGETCFPVAKILDDYGIPYILHSGDLDRHDERIRELQARLVAKPADAESVINAALMEAELQSTPQLRANAR